MSTHPGQATKSPKRPAISERRTGERQPFSASAEAVEVTSGARLAARVADLSGSGCYLDTINPFAVGAKVHVRIRRDNAELTSEGEVRTSQMGMGMGVAFVGLDDQRRAVIASWLDHAASPPIQNFEAESPWEFTKPATTILPRVQNDLAIRLIETLHKRGVLSESDMNDLLKGSSAPKTGT